MAEVPKKRKFYGYDWWLIFMKFNSESVPSVMILARSRLRRLRYF